MNTKFLLPAALVLAALAVAFVIMLALDTGEPPAPPSMAQEPVSSVDAPRADLLAEDTDLTSTPAGPASQAEPASVSTVDEALLADTSSNEAAREAVLDVIDEATVTYSVEGLGVLGPLLQHPDPAIREATIEGIVQLGEAAGAKTLREAARTAKDRKEAAAMIEAAQFLELPVFEPSSQ